MYMNRLYILRLVSENPNYTQRNISRDTSLGLGTVNAVLKKLRNDGLISKNGITQMGLEELDLYKVSNAVILTNSSTPLLEPLSFEMPEGLIAVKGERILERLIKQLKDAGIPEIILVVGKSINKYLYLRNKYEVKIVVNNEYKNGKSLSSLLSARNYLENTYICKSENYYPSNPFHKYEFEPFICAVENDSGSFNGYREQNQKSSAADTTYYGHIYMNKKLSIKFLDLIHRYYDYRRLGEANLDELYRVHMKDLIKSIKRYSPTEIIKIDNISTLYAFDKRYAMYNDTKILENICTALRCYRDDISYIEPMKSGGLNNRSFRFYCRGVPYVYRHPGVNAERLIDRKKEAAALRAAKELGIDDTLFYINEEEGWKISKYVFKFEEFDFGNLSHIKMLAEHLKTLHNSKFKLGFDFSYWTESERLVEVIKERDLNSFLLIKNLRKEMAGIYDLILSDPWQKSMCHNDIYEPNLIVGIDKLYLIDWEFAGDTDIGFDICKLFAPSLVSWDKLDDYLIYYFGRKTTEDEKIHLTACAAVQYYYWHVWAVYAEDTTDNISGYMMTWYDRIDFYTDQLKSHLHKEEQSWNS